MTAVTAPDWLAWHEAYDDVDSALSRRLRVVQDALRSALDRVDPGPVSLVSACAGQGRDVLDVLARHPRGADVRARLVELDPRNVEIARRRAAPLPGVEVVEGDAGTSSAYAGAVPAQVVLFCGVFGNVSDADVERSVRTLPQLCAPGATVIWTRHRRAPDLTPAIRRWFAEEGYTEIRFTAPEGDETGVGVHRYDGDSAPFDAAARIFTFVA